MSKCDFSIFFCLKLFFSQLLAVAIFQFPNFPATNLRQLVSGPSVDQDNDKLCHRHSGVAATTRHHASSYRNSLLHTNPVLSGLTRNASTTSTKTARGANSSEWRSWRCSAEGCCLLRIGAFHGSWMNWIPFFSGVDQTGSKCMVIKRNSRSVVSKSCLLEFLTHQKSKIGKMLANLTSLFFPHGWGKANK